MGIWFIEGILPLDGGPGNWQACMQKEGDGWRVQYRMRYFEDGKIHGSRDRISAYTMLITDHTEEEAERKFNEIAEGLAAMMVATTVPLTYLRIHGSGLRAMKLMSEQTWCHMRKGDEVGEG